METKKVKARQVLGADEYVMNGCIFGNVTI